MKRAIADQEHRRHAVHNVFMAGTESLGGIENAYRKMFSDHCYWRLAGRFVGYVA